MSGAELVQAATVVFRLDAAFCNNHCSFCSATGRSFIREPLEETLARLAAVPRTQGLFIRGGEPTLHPALPRVVQTARDLGFREIALETNARALAYPEYAAGLAAAGLTELRPYFQGANAEDHENVTQAPGSYSQTLQGAVNAAQAGVRVTPLIILLRSNLDGDWLSLLRMLGAKRAAFLYLSSDWGQFSATLTGLDFFGEVTGKVRGLFSAFQEAGIKVCPNEYPDSVPFHRLFEHRPHQTDAQKRPRSRAENKAMSLEDFSQRRLALRSYPSQIFMELTRNCNFRCVMCARPTTKEYEPALDMSEELFRNVADELFPYADYVDLRGWGETTIIRGWERKYLDYALKFDCRFGLITNLSVKNDAMWEKLVSRHFFLGVSVDGSTKETFEGIRRGASFETVLRNLGLITELMKKHDSPSDNLKLMMTVQDANLREMPQVVALAADLGVRNVQLSPCRDMNGDEYGGKDRVFIRRDTVKEALMETVRVARARGVHLAMTGSFNVPDVESALGQLRIKEGGCYNPWSRAYITPEGKIGPCNHLMYPTQVLLGDLRDGFWNAWNSQDFQLFRHMIDTRNRTTLCDYCFRHRYGD